MLRGLGSLLSYPHPPRGTNDPAGRRVFINYRDNHNICITYILYVCLPLLVSRCNDTYYLEVNVIYHANLPIGRLNSVRAVDPTR